MNLEVFGGDIQDAGPVVPTLLCIYDVYSDWWEAQYHTDNDPTPANSIPDYFYDEILMNFDSKNRFIYFIYIFIYIFSLLEIMVQVLKICGARRHVQDRSVCNKYTKPLVQILLNVHWYIYYRYRRTHTPNKYINKWTHCLFNILVTVVICAPCLSVITSAPYLLVVIILWEWTNNWG